MTTEPEAIPADVLELAKEAHANFGRSFVADNLTIIIARAIMADRASRAPVDGAEEKPVAWRWHGPRGGWIYDDERPRWWSEPVYAHPAPAPPDAGMALKEATALAVSLFSKHYSDDEDYASGRVKWEPLPDLRGVISQIDNMTTGLSRAALEPAPKPAGGEWVARDPVTLAECPVGLFMAHDELCLKTEYGNNEGRIDAYIVSSGEFFWGDAPQTIASQRAQVVRPISAAPGTHPAPASPDAELVEEAAILERLADRYAEVGQSAADGMANLLRDEARHLRKTGRVNRSEREALSKHEGDRSCAR